MTSRSTRPTWKSEEIKPAIERAMKVMKGSDTPLTSRTVAVCAGRYTNAPPFVLERYIKELNEAERTALGFPVPQAAPTVIKERAGISGGGWKAMRFHPRR